MPAKDSKNNSVNTIAASFGNKIGERPIDQTQWRDGTIPHSTRFDDPYYSVHDGRVETDYVFIGGNHLPERWPEINYCTIAELGFGTGLNFLQTVYRWQNLCTPKQCLEFISFEQYPLPAQAIVRAISRWPELDGLCQKLVNQWRIDLPKITIEFSESCQLQIYFADANTALPDLNLAADAWYLDGFAPAKNPQLWNSNLLQSVYDKTKTGGSFATYCAAGQVRRDLQQVGFEVERIKGFATKREMLRGRKPVERQ